jgi:hypothetical protein
VPCPAALGLLVVAVPGSGLSSRYGSTGSSGKVSRSCCSALGQALLVNLGLTGQGHADIGMAAFVDQLEAQAGLLHLAGLAHLALVETDEFEVSAL